MPKTHYLLRFDDICPTMNWAIWDELEAHMLLHQVRPILAVVPDNQDPKLMTDPPRADFWERVRRWQSLGWTIALHGYQHLYVNQEGGIMDLEPKSEFAGLPREVQEAKLRKGLAIFAEQGVRADAWIAPSHSFDETTVDLLVELGVPVISDGLWPWPFSDRGRITWIPTQHWDFKECRAGVWTICYHHNHWTPQQVEKFKRVVATHIAEITDTDAVMQSYGARQQTLGDRLAAMRRRLFLQSRALAAQVFYFFLPRKTASR